MHVDDIIDKENMKHGYFSMDMLSFIVVRWALWGIIIIIVIIIRELHKFVA